MISPPLPEQKPRVDAAEGLRELVAELRSLAERLELKARSHNLQATLQALERRIAEPRAVVILLSEHEELKRRFLERLLGPNLTQVPKPTTGCIRLEYRAAVEPSKSTPLPRAIETIQLSNPTLKNGLAVIDTPVMKSGDPDAGVIEFAEEADVCIFVLNADHELGEASQALLRRLPEAGERLEIVVENAEALSSEERLMARDRLMEALREHCRVESPRLTLVASAVTEDDGTRFWYGRFATFHSVMMRRGREHWLAGTRSMVADSISRVRAEIEFELESVTAGLRHSRLRVGLKDLDGLRARWDEVEGLRRERSAVLSDASGRPVNPEPAAVRPPHTAEGELPATGPEIAAKRMSMDTETPDVSEQGAADPDADAHLKRRLSAHFREKLTRRMKRGGATPFERRAGIALAIALLCLIIWALSPKGFFFRQEPGAAWDYRSPKPSPAKRAATVPASDPHLDLPKLGGSVALPETSRPAVPNLPSALPAKRRPAVRIPLARPIPTGATAGAARPAKRRHRHLLGLGKLWTWVRHGHRKDAVSGTK
jgi:hypothetical protein